MSNAFVSASEKLRSRVERVVKDIGLAEASKRFNVGESAILRILSGLTVRNGTIALVEKGLEK